MFEMINMKGTIEKIKKISETKWKDNKVRQIDQELKASDIKKSLVNEGWRLKIILFWWSVIFYYKPINRCDMGKQSDFR